MDSWALWGLTLGGYYYTGHSGGYVVLYPEIDPDFPKALARWNCRKFLYVMSGGNIRESLLVQSLTGWLDVFGRRVAYGVELRFLLYHRFGDKRFTMHFLDNRSAT